MDQCTDAAVVWYQNRFEVLRHAAAIAPTAGLVLEFGVASGSTIRCLAGSAALLDRMIYGFDWFEGLPEPWASYPRGQFACDIPEVPDNVELVVGEFSKTLTPFLDRHPGEAALVHIDCDLYSSTKVVLDQLTPRIVPGTVIVLDEYFIVVEHEQRAFHEWLETTGRKCQHVCRSIEQLCIVMES